MYEQVGIYFKGVVMFCPSDNFETCLTKSDMNCFEFTIATMCEYPGKKYLWFSKPRVPLSWITLSIFICEKYNGEFKPCSHKQQRLDSVGPPSHSAQNRGSGRVVAAWVTGRVRGAVGTSGQGHFIPRGCMEGEDRDALRKRVADKLLKGTGTQD